MKARAEYVVTTLFSLVFIISGTPEIGRGAMAIGPIAFPEAEENVGTFEYDKIWELTRRLLARQAVREFLRRELAPLLVISEEVKIKFKFEEQIKDISETQLFLILRQFPDFRLMAEKYLLEVPTVDPNDMNQTKLRQRFRKQLIDLAHQTRFFDEFQKYSDPTKPLPLVTADGLPAFESIRLFVNHPKLMNCDKFSYPDQLKGCTLIPPDNLIDVIVRFINEAEKEIALNVYEFNLKPIAEALVLAHSSPRSINVKVGIDKNVIESSAEVRDVRDTLKAAGIDVTEVDSVGLNHQKIVIRDWSLPGKGMALYSSGNFTVSGLHPNGDLGDRPVHNKASVPNANHLVIVKSDILAQLVHHELSKTLDLHFRGVRGDNSYPLSGTYYLQGPGKSYLITAFSPNGALGNINKHLLANMINLTSGKIRMSQFAFSSAEVRDALLARAEREVKSENHRFDFQALGEAGFAVEDWSILLNMSGLSFPTNEEIKEGAPKIYRPLSNNPWLEALGPREFRRVRSQIRIAPAQFSETYINVDGERTKVSAKLHHKWMQSGQATTVGTSFNFSNSALTNQEQLLIVVDPQIASESEGMFDWLFAQSSSRDAVYAEANRRNARRVKRPKK